MKFNKAELCVVAQDPDHNFNKEGILEFIEKQDGFFKSTETRIERWCRLRGNLLFYFKSKDHCSDPLGVLVLENCYLIEEDQLNIPNSFVVVFDESKLTLCAIDPQEKISWIHLMQRSSITYMRREIDSMMRKILRAKPSLPVTIESYRNTTGTVVDLNKPPFLELCISCDNLRCDGRGLSPNPRVSVFILKPPQDQWILYAQTEVLEHTSNPNFSATISFRESDGLDCETRVCLIVCDVKDRISDTSIHIGKTMMTIQSIKNIERTRLFLLSPEKETVGFITLTSWSLNSDGKRVKNNMSHATPKHLAVNSHSMLTHRRTQSLPPVLNNDVITPPNSALSLLYMNPVVSTFRFHSGLGGDISVSEILAEPNIVFEFPQQLLKLLINEETCSRDEIFALGNLTDQWEARQSALLTQHCLLISLYEVAVDTFKRRSETGVFYRKSVEKTETSLEFAPINLHVQRFCARNDSLRHVETYDTITVGAFSANSMGYSKGGLHKLIASLDTPKKDKADKKDKASICEEAVARIRLLRRDLNLVMKSLLASVQERNCDKLLACTRKIQEKIFMLRRVLDSSLVAEAFHFLDCIRLPEHNSNITVACKSQSDQGGTEPPGPPTECPWVLTDPDSDASLESCYKCTDEPEPWDLIQLNIKASIICLCSKVKAFCDKYYANNTRQISMQDFTTLVRDDSGIFPSRNLSQDVAKDCTQTLFSSCFLTPDPSPCDDDAHKGSNPTTNNVVETFSYPARSRPTCPAESPSMDPDPSVGLSIDPEVLTNEKEVEWLREIAPSMKKLRHAIGSLVRTARLTRSLFRLQDPQPRAQLKHTIQYRKDICFSQALTSVVTGLMTKLWCGKTDSAFLWVLTTIGPVVEFEGLLSYIFNDAHRISDMIVAIEELTHVEFQLVAGGTFQSSSVDNGIGNKIPIPVLRGTRKNLRVLLPVPEQLLSLHPAKESGSPSEAPTFKITPVFFNIGINEEATAAAKLGKDKAQHTQNQVNFDKLFAYYSRYQILYPEEDTRRNTLSGPTNRRKVQSLFDLMTELKNEVSKKKSKNVAVLQLASKICRRLGGIRLTSCKSAKDRTAMSVTLEQINLLRQDFDLAENETKSALDCIRTEGVRLTNCKKNVSVAKYSFSSVQLAMFPADYKPPAGTFAASIS